MSLSWFEGRAIGGGVRATLIPLTTLIACSICVAANLTGGASTDLIIQTVAGTGVPGFSGDGGPASEARLDSPAAVAIDGSGNLYIADVRNHRIRRVDTEGTISTVAGNGAAGFGGDGGPAVQAQLNQPLGVAVDGQGNLYIADTLNNRIRKVDADGAISTVAGNGSEGFGGDGGRAVDAKLSRPVGLIVDAEGTLFIADVFNNRIRKVDTDGTISTVAGDGEAGFKGDGGPAIAAQLNRPRDVAVDGDGNVYIADTDNTRIRKVTPDGIISTVAGNGRVDFSGDGGPAREASLNIPRSVAADVTGRILIADMSNNRIRQVDLEGIITTVAGNGVAGFNGDGGLAIEASLSLPRGVRLGRSGAIFIADLDNHRVRLAR
jgi:sugar lactone lactonase YvrE